MCFLHSKLLLHLSCMLFQPGWAWFSLTSQSCVWSSASHIHPRYTSIQSQCIQKAFSFQIIGANWRFSSECSFALIPCTDTQVITVVITALPENTSPSVGIQPNGAHAGSETKSLPCLLCAKICALKAQLVPHDPSSLHQWLVKFHIYLRIDSVLIPLDY